jgi:DNA-binding CsgD family transcriptional regulator/PAS domain-containing protein
MSAEASALALIELIYEAALEPKYWELFLAKLSNELGGAAAVLVLELPDGSDADRAPRTSVYRHGLGEEYTEVFQRHYARGLPWGSFLDLDCSLSFVSASDRFPDTALPSTDFYREYMQPQMLAAEGPIAHVIHGREPGHLSGLALYRREGARAFCAADFALCDRLVPHLARAYAIHCELRGSLRERAALAAVLDRLPIGVVLLDARQRAVMVNRSAQRIAGLDEGLRIDGTGLHARDPKQQALLRKLIAHAIESGSEGGIGERSFLSLPRASGRRPLVLMATSLLDPGIAGARCDVAACVFVSDPNAREVCGTEVLELLYNLTGAEAELVALLAEGRSLEEIADARRVTMNTVRSQLKQVFSKTATSRQGELLQLVLTGVATLQDPAPKQPPPPKSARPQSRTASRNPVACAAR